MFRYATLRCSWFEHGLVFARPLQPKPRCGAVLDYTGSRRVVHFNTSSGSESNCFHIGEAACRRGDEWPIAGFTDRSPGGPRRWATAPVNGNRSKQTRLRSRLQPFHRRALPSRHELHMLASGQSASARQYGPGRPKRRPRPPPPPRSGVTS